MAVRSRPIPDPGPTDVCVRTRVSAVSAGTEGLIYRGEAPASLPADSELETFEGDLSFPLSYGYAAVGEVDAVGSDVDDDWLGRQVFAYNAHESHFLANPDDLLQVPDEVSPREAALFANLETAVTLLLDGEPLLGERVAVFGQGVVGLLTTALLAQTPTEALVTFDPDGDRRRHSTAVGADRALDPTACAVEEAFADGAANGFGARGSRADLTYELSGNPDALDDALAVTGFDGRLLVGSWYGTKPTTVDLGGRFHRDRIDIRSTQVSTIDPRLSGRWSRERRHELTWSWLCRLDLEQLFTHEFPLEDAATAYELLEERADGVVQVLFTYE
ncbi:alcohol dehydrogenase zinc-binding domain-containing protein [Natrialba chahannaoensis JCM 10990]|uniref:Alcohol dehydrogenase zinc-binding domain-containing protein n=1 Tax=Natrialba chahannaoensis JCM 10990 TaxID=1227492 RepID=M0AMA1_9EURY|nr:alcohol dehydrogenase zinc-binding domain-containing protein [Natrialba chahannaoensis JCM 10990]